MWRIHFHYVGGNSPLCACDIELNPLRSPELYRTNKEKRG